MHTEGSQIQALTAIEARILGALMEKEATTPDVYPLSLNSLVTACNQKTSREPVMELETGAVGHCLRQLQERGLVQSSYSTRVERFSHRVGEVYGLTRLKRSLICLLLLRGPQTLNELLTRSERLAEFQGPEHVRETLDRLAEREQPLVIRLPLAPGQREERYAHLLSGPVDVETLAAQSRASPGRREGLEERVAALEAEVESLKQALAALTVERA